MLVLKQLVEKAHKRDCKVYVSFMNFKKAYGYVDMGALWQVITMHGVDKKLLKDIKSFLLKVEQVLE